MTIPAWLPAFPWRRQVRLRLPRGADARAVAGILGLILLLFREPLLLGRTFFERDIHLQWYGQAQSFVRSVSSGSWPVWDPFVSFGQPLWANPNNQILYPLTWLNLLLPPWRYYVVFVAFHTLLAALGLYVFGRRIGLSHGGSFVAAAVWTASGPLLSLVSLWNHLAGFAWLPWVLITEELALRSGQRRHALLWGASMAAQVFAGSPDALVMTQVLALGWLLRELRRPRIRSGLVSGAWAWGFALALSAAQWLPTLDLIRESVRRSLPADERMFWSLHPLGLIQVALPVFLGEIPLAPGWKALLTESREPLLRSLYLGMATVGLVGAAFAQRGHPLRPWCAAVGGTATLLALGEHTPAYGVAQWLIPPLQALRFPVKAVVLSGFCWALLAGMGFDAWMDARAFRRSWLFVVAPLGLMVALGCAGMTVAAGQGAEWEATTMRLAWATCLAAVTLVLAVWSATRRRPAWAAPALAVLALADLAGIHNALNPTAPAALFAYRPETLDHVPRSPSSRLYVYEYAYRGTSRQYLGRESAYLVVRRPPGLPSSQTEALALRTYLFPPVSGAWGILGSYDRDLLGLHPPHLAKLSGLLRPLEGTPGHLRLLQLGAVGQVVALHDAGLGDLIPLASLPSFFAEPIRVFRVPDPVPRVYAVGSSRVVDDPAALRALVDPGFDPHSQVLLATGQARNDPQFSGTARLSDARPDRVQVEADLARPGYVVLVDTYDSRWRAKVDGQGVTVLRANVAFRAVQVPAGRHRIEFVYRPPSLLLGLAISAAALLGGLPFLLRLSPFVEA